MVLCEIIVMVLCEIMNHYKIEHLLLVLYVQKKIRTTSKTAYMFVFCLFFFSELIVVKIDHVSELGNYNRNSI